MNLRHLPVLVAFLLLSESAHAQIVGQLPVVTQFTTTASVSVPDRGEIVLGGVSQSRTESVSSWGLPRNTAFGASTFTTISSARVRIHSLEEMDRAILRHAEASRMGMTGSQKSEAALRILQNRTGHFVPQRPFGEQNFPDRSRALQILKAKR